MGVLQHLIRHLSVQTADFFRADNPEGMEARNEVNVYGLLLFWVEKELIIDRFILFSSVSSGILHHYYLLYSFRKKIDALFVNEWIRYVGLKWYFVSFNGFDLFMDSSLRR